MRRLDEHQTEAALKEFGLDELRPAGFAFRDPARAVVYDWHAHPYHQLAYAVAGTVQIETSRARYLLPAGRAAWIPAGERHRTLIHDADIASLYFAPEMLAPGAGERVRILITTPVMREMVVHALRWPQGPAETDPLAQSFFRTLALMCGDWLDSELPLSLSSATDPRILRAMDQAMADPAGASHVVAQTTAGMSERSFRRAFARETGMSWQAWLAQARIMIAMGRLAEGGRVTDVAGDVGYASLSAFAQAFTQLAGERPAAYRARQRAASGGSAPRFEP